MEKAEWLQIAGLVVTAITAAIGLVIARMISTVHILINSRMTQLLDITRTGAKAEGVELGRLNEQAHQKDK